MKNDTYNTCIPPRRQVRIAEEAVSQVMTLINDIVNGSTPTSIVDLYKVTAEVVAAGDGNIEIVGDESQEVVTLRAIPVLDDASRDVVVFVCVSRVVLDLLSGGAGMIDWFTAVTFEYVNRQDIEELQQKNKNQYACFLLGPDKIKNKAAADKLSFSLDGLRDFLGWKTDIATIELLNEAIATLQKCYPDGDNEPVVTINEQSDKDRGLVVVEFTQTGNRCVEHIVQVDDAVFDFYKDKPLSYERLQGRGNVLYCDVREAVKDKNAPEPAEYMMVMAFHSITSSILAAQKRKIEAYIAECVNS